MIVVTGGAGFIGSNIVKSLNNKGYADILVVDDLQDGRKFKNLVDCDILDYIDQSEFLKRIQGEKPDFEYIDAVFHEGACSSTTEWDGRYMMENNYAYSKAVLHYCLERHFQFLYASSAAVYGDGHIFKEDRQYEKPLNVYGYSKFLFDQYVRAILPKAQSQIAGFRYFNVYGPREFHKGTGSSVAFHLNNQIKDSGVIKLFEGSGGYADGEQRRDFVCVDDVVAVNLWFYEHGNISGIFNVGTGRSQTFKDVANAVLNWHGKGKLEYIPFPDHLKGRYQSFTEADISKLREVGCNVSFRSVEAGVKEYLDWLNKE